ncbi:universal stress protein [Celeribacter sp.]|uniref:universal stress protein n=1 Tax=Celeribacter sp. TaxID=1890673 RepID=UPI003A925848
MKKIMLATDFSERSDRALRRATLLAKKFGASLSIIHAVDDDQPSRIVESESVEASTLLRQLQDTVQTVDGIPCESRVVLADAFVGIAQAVDEEAPDLLVIGPHRRQALRDVFVGTTAERTIRSVACPVLMVNAPPVGPYRHVMLATDLSSGSKRAVDTCFDLGLTDGVDVSFLHVYDAPAVRLTMSHTIGPEGKDAYLEELRSDAAKDLAQFVRQTNLRSSRQLVRFWDHAPADEILKATQEHSVGLVVLGTEGREGVAKFVLGSVAEAVLRKADCDVLAVPPASASRAS